MEPQMIAPKKPNTTDYQVVPKNDVVEGLHSLDLEAQDDDDYSKRGQWLRAAILGASDGLLSTAALMMGVGAVRQDAKTMILTGGAGMVAGACSMAIGEFVSVYTQYDVEMAQLERTQKSVAGENDCTHLEEMKEKVPNPWEAAAASALAFSVGAAVPLLAASNIRNYQMRLAAVVAAVSMALILFGAVGAVLGKTSPVKSSLRVLIGGWVAMGITFGVTKLIGRGGFD